MCRLPSLRAVCWASRLVVDEVVPAGAGRVVPVALQQQLLPQAQPLEEAPPDVAEQLLHQAPRALHPRPAASPEARNPGSRQTPAPRGRSAEARRRAAGMAGHFVALGDCPSHQKGGPAATASPTTKRLASSPASRAEALPWLHCARDGSACQQRPPSTSTRDAFCYSCGGLKTRSKKHDAFPYHRARDEAGSVTEPRHVDDRAEHPNGIWCFGAQMALKTFFGTAAPAAARLRGAVTLEPVPPNLPTPPADDEVGSGGIQDLINVDLDL
ncbi:hypothetical protein HPB47_005510 [Ixodes persulcatus]|uniref:Uncharacterized protein n=1 Tax=Ixodes persulcatus TaxID=34615 RepID=A0AC60PCX6_IXOPE|nr:hypothetical protein HPB47_005510 [Ixodes persulcatus]